MAKAPNPFLPSIAARIREVTNPLGSQEAAAAFLGIAQPTLSRARRGENDPSAFVLRRISERLDVSLDYLLCLSDERRPAGRLGARKGAQGFRPIPLLSIEAAAGLGLPDETAHIQERLEFPVWMLERLGLLGARLALMRARGDSMAPAIAPGALLLVDVGAKAIPQTRPSPTPYDPGDVYVFVQDGERRVKHLRASPDGLLVVSDNPAEIELLRGAARRRLDVLGRVVWWDNRL